jgi:nitroreductase
MDVSEAIKLRKSIRAFKADPVPQAVLREILAGAIRAPSWANTQPWEFAITAGKPLEEIREGFLQRGAGSPTADVARPPEFPPRYAERIRALDKLGRLNTGADWEARRVQNFKHFGSPAVIYLLTAREFYYQSKGLNVWALYDCGSVVQNIMLMATERGRGTIAQAQAVVYPDILRKVLGTPESLIFLLGIAIGYPDWKSQINQISTEREDLEKIASWRGF